MFKLSLLEVWCPWARGQWGISSATGHSSLCEAGPAEEVHPPAPSSGLTPVVQIRAAFLGGLTSGKKCWQLLPACRLCKENVVGTPFRAAGLGNGKRCRACI